MTCFSFLFSRKKAPFSDENTVEIDEEVSGIQNTTLFTYRELKMATENFHYSNKIGEGGFGAVYKGTFRDGTMAAIKVLSAYSNQGVREFLTEINVIADIEHENLVKLCGCCVEGNHRILVYGYLENNSLAQTLLGGGHSSMQFSWQARRNICIGVAKGLTFLHEEVRPHIVHRDIKASNILLDKNLMPKISDFGLAKLFPDNLTHITTRVAGTAGYLAPEYAIRGQLTRKADIYSFGVLLLEIVTGRSNTNRKLPLSEQYLLERAWNMYEHGQLVELVDTSLNGDYNNEEAQKFLKIALLCTQDLPKLRPSMSEVVKMLMGEESMDDLNISKPGLLSEFMSLRGAKGKPDMTSEGTGEGGNSSSPSGNITTSYATMTFNSIYDRSN
ncbi:cold-responsive protein kinase 1-like isoform X1 [Durio zibethinus]|uniref:Cold-responsive protein kinase 1-like isoform X1 n=2 Tax=Durio zibethinus TaxID=66656 RepID=A0A6P5WML3_DURZI|nr:cold-responsive protein kinase 1-like isoform X1 [Durio zibethinus]XP_022717232.1 cold-responsive protein kinase 1-like isoform X1 [Durio zibethinus]XP_022717233.1 cold-responsive protein kinase 1-like isoform X1 [Durio zibethinus]XP_022717234.1 cold-responsive protein kinase 1-like isoform X1 [Durio zibethinus]XP_022717235.1 cold-responsive protein kinase 1-like isoform X1 [Durio zibethinus]